VSTAVFARKLEFIAFLLAEDNSVEVGAGGFAAVDPAEDPLGGIGGGWVGGVVVPGHFGHDGAGCAEGIGIDRGAGFGLAGEGAADEADESGHPWFLIGLNTNALRPDSKVQ
jgi:hypothetical protein